MIRILRMDEISEDEIFERNDSAADVSDIVAGIVADVRHGPGGPQDAGRAEKSGSVDPGVPQ